MKRKSQLLTEGVETKNMSAAKHYLYDRFHWTEKQAMELIGAVKHDVPNSRLQKCKFIKGVVRMYTTHQLTDAETITSLNRTLKYVASNAHVNEYDNDLNGLSVTELIDKFKTVITADIEKSRQEMSEKEFVENHKYTIIPVNDFDTAEEYNKYTTWCVTSDPDMYYQYTAGGIGRFYFCLRDDYKEVEEERTEGCPLDDYGLSMIAVSVTDTGECNTITCRWNHDNDGNDNIMTVEQLSDLLGRNFYQTFVPYTEKELEIKRADAVREFIEEIEVWYDETDLHESDYVSVIGLKYDDIDDEYEQPELEDDDLEPDYDDFYENHAGEYYQILGFIVNSQVATNIEDMFGDDKYIIITEEFDPVIEDMFDDAHLLSDTKNIDNGNIFIAVKKKKKYNVVNFSTGKYLSEQWFDYMPMLWNLNQDYSKLIFVVKNNNKEHYFDVNGKPYGKEYDHIQHVDKTSTAFVKHGNLEDYLDIVSGKVYIKDIEKRQNIVETYCVIKCVDENPYIYFFSEKKNLYVCGSNIPLKNMNALWGWHHFNGAFCHKIVSTDDKQYYVDFKNGVTYDSDGNTVDKID